MNTEGNHKNYLAIAVLSAVVIGGIVFAFKSCAETPTKEASKAYELTRKIAKDVIKALEFQPVVIINQEVIFDQSAPIAELALAEKGFTHTYTWEQSWLKSKKKIVLKGNFKAKGGYDLTQPFTISILNDGKEISAKVPASKILSVELLGEEIVEDQDGWWNDVTKEDRQNAKNAFLASARQKADQSSLKKDVDDELERRLRSAADLNGPLQIAVQISKL